MKNLQDIIQEKLQIGSKTKVSSHKYQPKDRDELKELVDNLIKERGNAANLNDIDTSEITDMSYLFDRLDAHNIDISQWNVSNVINMEGIFNGCVNFNSDLSKWDVSKVTDMHHMFYGCEEFNSDLSNWNVSKVTDMFNTFKGCTSLKNIPSWYK